MTYDTNECGSEGIDISISYRKHFRGGLSLMEMLIAMAIMAVVFAAILPQFRNIQNSWASKQGVSEALQNGRVLIDHINRNLSRAERITAVSDPDVADGFIVFEVNDGFTYRYEISASRYVQYGTVGSLSDLAGPVGGLQFTCYDAYDLDTVTTNPTDIRCVKVRATMKNTAPLGQDRTLLTAAYLRVNSPKNLPALYKEPASIFEFNVAEGGWPALSKLDDTHYLCTYMGPQTAGWAIVIQIDNTDWTVKRGNALEFDDKNGQYSALLNIDSDHYLCAYAGAGDEGTAAVFTTNKPMKKVILETSLVFDSNRGMYPSLSKIDDEHYLCAYTGKFGGEAVVLSVDPDDYGLNKESTFIFDAGKGMTPSLTRIDAEHHLCVYSGNLDRGKAVVLNVNTTNWQISKQMTAVFESARCISPAVSQIDSNRYLVAYAGPSNRGRGVVLNVANIFFNISTLSRFEFDADVGLFPDLKKIENDRYVCVYEGKNSDAWANIFHVNLSNWKVTPGIAVEYDPQGGESPAMVQIDENHFLCVYQGANNDGWAAILNTDPPVLP